MGLTAITRRLTNFFSAKGSLITWDGSAVGATELLIGTTGQVLTVSGGAAVWAAAAGNLTSSNFVFNETPSGTINGSNAAFTLANTPTAGTVRVYVDGVRMNPGGSNDYTISTNTITFNTGAIPQTGDIILCDYLK